MKQCNIYFPMQNKEQQNLLEYQYVDHHIKIVKHDRDYSNFVAHEQGMLPTKTEERPTEKRAESKKKAFCLKQRTKSNKILPDYQHVEHRIEIVAMTENVDDHGMLSNKTDERPT